MNVFVWRVEDAEGRGPYNNRSGEVVDDSVTLQHPRHGRTEHIDLARNRLYGFESRAQFFDWFDENERAMLQRVGFVFAQYSVPVEDVFPGNGQCIFYSDRAERVTVSEVR